MLETHKNLIISNLPQLVAETDLEALFPELLRRGVFNEQIVRRILNPLHSPKQKNTDLYLQILKRGPGAFAELQDSLNSTNHSHLASILKMQSETHFHQRASLNSVGSLGSQTSSDVNNGIHSSCEKTSHLEDVRNPRGLPQPHPMYLKSPDVGYQDYSPAQASSGQNTSAFDKRNRVFAPPFYQSRILKGTSSGVSGFEESDEKFRPVIVKQSESWPVQRPGSPDLYKMNSNPRGCALVINNITFDDSDYPRRDGADNDEARFKSLLQQLHFKVEVHRNKTKNEMENIVRDFSRKRELQEGDCVWVTLMSHGEEGESSEGAKILGTDGVGYSIDQVVGNFYNDVCPQAQNKPKIFTFQCCRGNLVDVGVQNRTRTESDGKKVTVPRNHRTQSDIIMCFPTPTGMQANRNRVTGAWFIQAIVDVFSELACTLSLDELLKKVDNKIEEERNGIESDNFQTMTIQMIGWNKNLYFSPGLCWNPETKETIRIDPPQANGSSYMDTTDSEAMRLKDDKNEESSDEGKQCCFNRLGCNPV